MFRLARTASAIAVVAFAASLSAAQSTVPKNIIVMVGDGMGPAHFTACRLSRTNGCRITTMPVVGLVTTQSANHPVTDSAAAATAYATGVKTNYEMLGVDPAGTPHPDVVEVAEQNGKTTGLVTTSYFYDATPAAFAAHAIHRDRHAEIVEQMLRSGAEIIAGSGAEAFGTEGIPNLADVSAKSGYMVVSTLEGLEKAPSSKVLALFPAQPRDAEFPMAPLASLARVAIERLSKNAKGFFLLVEHEGTDTASHHNNSADVLKNIAAFDDAVAVALDYAAKSGDTLVVVLGDHETGGLRITENRFAAFRLEWSTSEHTGVSVPVFAYGPGSATFGRFQDNSDIGKTLLSLVR